MHRVVLLVIVVLVLPALALAADPNDPKEYREIIERRCTLCHSQERIEKSIAAGENMGEILSKMMRMGAQLTEREKEVLGIFWGPAGKKE